MQPIAYLDHNATTPLREAAKQAITDALDQFGNPSSVHAPGRQTKAKLDKARAQIAALVGARPRDVVFTGGGTEGNNTVLRQDGWSKVFVSAVEHECSFAALKAGGVDHEVLPVDANGVLRLDVLKEKLIGADKTVLVSVMAANNETGVLQPLEQIGQIVAESGARFHTDAAQYVGKYLLDINAIKSDYITLTGHKFGGPKGVGAIILSPTAPLSAFLVGGGQELGRRSGTENTLGIVGMGAAAEEALMDLNAFTELSALRDRFEQAVRTTANDLFIAGGETDRLANTSCIAMPGVKGETQVMHMDLNGIAISSGSACSSGKVKISHVLEAMGEADRAGETIRVSLGKGSTDDDIDRLIEAWKALYQRTRG